MDFHWKKLGLFAAGVLFGTAGIRILSSRDAKKVYVHCTAAALRARDDVLDKVTAIQEGCVDIYEEAKNLNAQRDAQDEEAVFGDLEDEEPASEDSSVSVVEEEDIAKGDEPSVIA